MFHPLRAELLELLGAAERPTTPVELQAALANPVALEKVTYHLSILRGTGRVDTSGEAATG